MSINTIYGTVSAKGNKISGSGFSVKKKSKSTGTYLISFDNEFSEIPAIVGSQTGYGDEEYPVDILDFPHLQKGGATVITGDGPGNFSDRQFSFIAIGQE